MYNCAPTSHVPSRKHKNLSYLYNESEVVLHPKYQIFNFSEDSSKVFVRINADDLLIRDVEDEADKYAMIELHYSLYETLSVMSLVDSGTVYHKLIIEDNKTDYTFSFDLRSPPLINSHLRVKFKDQFSERLRSDYLKIHKNQSVSRQSLMFEDLSTNDVLFGSQLLLKRSYRIKSPLLNKNQLYIQTQKPVNKVSNLPFFKQRTPEITFQADTTIRSLENTIKVMEPSLIFLKFDSIKTKGVAVHFFDSLENNLHTPSQMLEPLHYLLSPKEYNNITSDPQPKIALDRFWLKTGENIRHAKEMIKVYYKRVNTANKYFTSHKKGWMTDRGMIHIIYGEPTTIYKSETLERWIYGTEETEESLLFDFNYNKNTLSQNDYELFRNEEYKKSWFQAIDSWRNGRIYSIAK